MDFLSHEAGRYEEFDLRFSSKVESLIDENGSIRGVRYMSRDGVHEVKAPVVIGADGRFSTVRERAGLVPNKTSPPMDILWFELPDQRWPRCRRDLLHHQGGFARFVTMFVLGLPTMGEVHHLVDTMQVGHYTPGTVTAVPSVICGVLFLRALVKEYRPSKTVRVTETLQLPVAA